MREELYGPEPTDVAIDDAARAVRIAWSDGRTTAYSFGGLRGWCPCAVCQGHVRTWPWSLPFSRGAP
jgi:DUF971 family protein